MKLLKNIRLVGWIGFILITVALFMNSSMFKKPKVIVAFVSEDSPCKDVISEGSVISEINGIRIENPDDFTIVKEGLEGVVTFRIDGNPRSCAIPINSSLNVNVRQIESRWIKLGIDLEGGTRFLLKPREEISIEQTITKIEERIKEYEITNIEIEKVEDQIQIIVGSEDEERIKEIISRGIFEAKLTEDINFIDGKKELMLGDDSYEISLEDNVIEINNSRYEVGQNFILDEISFEIGNISGNTTTLSINMFDDGDVTEVLTGKDYSRVVKQDPGYVFVFTVKLSEEGMKKFAKATKGREVIIDPQSGETFLKNPLVILVDDEAIVNLPISGADAGQEKTDLIIWGYRVMIKEARDDMLRMVSVLKTKRLPNLEIVKKDVMRNAWGEKFINSVSVFVIVISVGVSIVGFVRYRDLKIAGLMFLITISEIVLILGVASSQVFALIILLTGVILSGIKDVRRWYGWLSLFLMFLIGFSTVTTEWILNVPAIGGIILVMLMSVTQTIILTDQLLKRKATPKKYKIVLDNIWKFIFMITLVMFFLFFFDATKGFATMTVVGLMIGTMISKPAYFCLIEWLKSKT